MKNKLYRYLLYTFIVFISLIYGDSVYLSDNSILIKKPILVIIVFLVTFWCFSDIFEKLKNKIK